MTADAMRAKAGELQKQHDALMAEQERRRQDEARYERGEALFDASGCPDRHATNLYAIEEWQNPKWLELRDLFVQQAGYANGYLVALLGKRGVGKTQLAVSVVRKCAGELMTCQYVKAMDLFRDLRRAYAPVAKGERGEREDDIIDKWVGYDLLVIDECHQRGETDWEQNTLVNLLDRRYDSHNCTILIANQTRAEFAESMGSSIVSRIHETGEAFECDWGSYRKQGNWRKSGDDAPRIPSGTLRPRTYR
jgi:DNA replication protein DnaC